VAPLSQQAVVWLLDDGTFVDDTRNESADVVDFDTHGSDLCLLHGDGTVTCSLSGPIAATQVTEVAVSSGLRCLLLENGEARCDDQDDGSVVVPGPYSAIAVANPYFCGILADGAIECTNLSVPLFDGSSDLTFMDPVEGSFTKLAMDDDNVCGITTEGPIRCGVTYSDSTTDWAGGFTAISGGDHTICAIGVDGAVSCWLSGSPMTVPEGW